MISAELLRSHAVSAGVFGVAEVDDVLAGGAQRVDVGAFVFCAADAHRFEARVRGERDGQRAGAALSLELRAVLAGKVVCDVGGGKSSSFFALHCA